MAINAKTITINTETAPFVLRAFNLYAEGSKSLEKVVNQLYQEGFIYQSSKPKIGKSHLESILKNIFYIGSFVFKGKIYRGIHEPLISKEIFKQVQEAFKKDSKPLYREEHSFAFAGLLKCGVCGSTITAEMKKEKYVYYHCTHGKRLCDQVKYTKEESLDAQFQEIVNQIYLSDEQKQWIIEALKQSNEDKQEFHEERVNALQNECQKLRERINRIYIDKLDGIISESFWLEKHNQWNTEHDRIQELIKAHQNANKNYLETGIKFLELANKAPELYSLQNFKERAELLKILLSNCTLKDGIIDCELKKPFDILVKFNTCTLKSG